MNRTAAGRRAHPDPRRIVVSASSAPKSPPSARQAKAVLAWLEKRGTKATREGMARYGIPSEGAYGVSVGALRAHAKRLGRSHELAAALWKAGRYEARMLASFVDDPAAVSP